jgi:hypothetical protein
MLWTISGFVWLGLSLLIVYIFVCGFIKGMKQTQKQFSPIEKKVEQSIPHKSTFVPDYLKVYKEEDNER